MDDTQDVRPSDHIGFSLLIEPPVGAWRKIEQHHRGCVYIASNVSGIEKMSRGSG
jgi:hypothetical protein